MRFSKIIINNGYGGDFMKENKELLLGLFLIAGGIVIGGKLTNNAINNYTTDTNKEKLTQIINNIEANDLEEIEEINSIETLIINSKENKAIVIANVDVNTGNGIETMKYAFKFNTNEQFAEFIYHNYYSRTAYKKDVDDLTLSSHEATDVLKAFVNASEGNLVEYSPITDKQQEEMLMYLNNYNSENTVAKTRSK